MVICEGSLTALEADPDVGFVIDAPHEGAPLILCFGFANWTRLPHFDFGRRLTRIAQQNDYKINKILIRDSTNFWYQHGVVGLGRDVHEVAASLRDVRARLSPSWIAAVGQSMGAYAAILFGLLLGVDRVLAFGPLSYLRSEWARRDEDIRWLPVMCLLDRFPPFRSYRDLPALLLEAEHPPTTHIVYGTSRSTSADNRDDIHLRRFLGLRRVSVEEISCAPHAVAKWLIDTGLMNTVLERRLLSPPDPTVTIQPIRPVLELGPPWILLDDTWRQWIAENLSLGAHEMTLMTRLVERHGFHPGDVRREIDCAKRKASVEAQARRRQV